MHIDACGLRKWFLRAAFLATMLTCVVTELPASAGANGVDINDTRLLSQPAISKDHVAFIYAGDLWVAGIDGKNVKRLTADELCTIYRTQFSVLHSYDRNRDFYDVCGRLVPYSVLTIWRQKGQRI